MKYFIALLALATFSLRAEVIEGTSRMVCMDRAILLALLDRYDEVPLARGLGEDGTLVIYANPKTGTYTLVERESGGLYCVFASGERFEPVPETARRQFIEQRRQRYN